jgi:F420-dependent oxidoreductase-like protein
VRRLAIAVNWQGERPGPELWERVQVADAAGVHSVWVAEAWGRDAFTLLVQLAERTRRLQLATGIVNIYSRSPAALAQHFATLDEVSGGRAIIGLGASGPQVIEHFHGVPFTQPLQRMREYVEIIRCLTAGRPLRYAGEIFRLERGFTLRFTPVRDRIPIFIAALGPRSIRQTAAIADGWLPIWTPLGDLPAAIAGLRAAARRAGRREDELLVRSPGTTVVTPDVAHRRREARRALAFYVARMGTFYRAHLTRLGYGAVAERIAAAYAAQGAGAALAAVPEDLAMAMGLVTDSVAEARERLQAEAEAGVDIHQVEVAGYPPAETARIYEQLLA